MKTLADILKESREQAQKTVDVIDTLIAENKEAGVVWPELNVCHNCDGTGCYNCNGTGVIDDDDPGYDELGAEADREEN